MIERYLRPLSKDTTDWLFRGSVLTWYELSLILQVLRRWFILLRRFLRLRRAASRSDLRVASSSGPSPRLAKKISTIRHFPRLGSSIAVSCDHSLCCLLFTVHGLTVCRLVSYNLSLSFVMLLLYGGCSCGTEFFVFSSWFFLA